MAYIRYDLMTIPELKQELKKRKLPISGSKKILLERLEAFNNAQSSANTSSNHWEYWNQVKHVANNKWSHELTNFEMLPNQVKNACQTFSKSVSNLDQEESIVQQVSFDIDNIVQEQQTDSHSCQQESIFSPNYLSFESPPLSKTTSEDSDQNWFENFFDEADENNSIELTGRMDFDIVDDSQYINENRNNQNSFELEPDNDILNTQLYPISLYHGDLSDSNYYENELVKLAMTIMNFQDSSF